MRTEDSFSLAVATTVAADLQGLTESGPLLLCIGMNGR